VPKAVRVTVKAAAAVAGAPPVVVRGPVVAPGITNRRRAVLVWSRMTLLVPLTATAVTKSRRVPVSVTSVPTLPEAGEKDVMAWACTVVGDQTKNRNRKE
jgi:hypothetical protein